MVIRFRCPSGHLLSIGGEHAGKRLRCPKCLKIATVPLESALAQPEAVLVTAVAAEPAMVPSPPVAMSHAVKPAMDGAATAVAGAAANGSQVVAREPTPERLTAERLSSKTSGQPQVSPPVSTAKVSPQPPVTTPTTQSLGPSQPQTSPQTSAIRSASPASMISPAKPHDERPAVAAHKSPTPAAPVPPLPAGPIAPPRGARLPERRPAAARLPQPPLSPPPQTSSGPPVAIGREAPPLSPPNMAVLPAVDTPPLLPGGNHKVIPPPLPTEIPPLPPLSARVTAPPMARLAVRNPFAEDPREQAPVEFEGELKQAVIEQSHHAHRHAQAAAIGYRPDRFKVQNVYLLAMGLLLLTLFNAAPALPFWDLSLAPDWARVVLFMTLVQIGFVAWMVMLPDWSTVWVSMLVFAAVATLYGVALAIAVVTPHGRPVALEMDDVRQSARLWCAAVILLTCSMTYLCGRLSHQWYKGYQLGR